MEELAHSDKPLKFLVADDDEEYTTNVSEILRGMGHDVVACAMDGEQAVEMFNTYSDNIDVALLDVMMPKKNGFYAARDIRRRAPGVKIIFMSGFQKNRELCSEIDNVGFLAKPFLPSDIARETAK